MFRQRLRYKVVWLFFLGLGICLGAFLVTSCTSSQQKRVNSEATKVFNELYVPKDTNLIGIVERDDALAYVRGCTGVLLDIAYGTNKTLDEILQEYQTNLLESEWVLRPDYEQTKDALFFQKGALVNLFIGSSTTQVDLTDSDYLTIYVVLITYTEPSNRDCIG